MPKRTIAKIFAFVILLPVLAGCGLVASSFTRRQPNDVYDTPRVIGRLANDEINESSGIAASKCHTDVFWTHNDSGDDAFIFAFNSVGENLGTWRVAGAKNLDWEDIAAFRDSSGRCFIYIGEIGDNEFKRPVHTVYRVAEPAPSDASRNTKRSNALDTAPAEVLNYTYPAGDQNAETLMVHPVSGEIYVLTKSREQPSGIFKLKPVFGSEAPQTAEKIAEIKVPSVPFGLLTGGDISPDGRRVAMCDYSAGFELTLPADASRFDDIWRQRPIEIDLGDRDTGESITYTASGDAIIVTMEKKRSPIIEIRRRP